MTLDQLNEHLNLVDRLSQAKELRATLLESVQPGSQLTGMPHAPGIHDKVGDLGVELADIDDGYRLRPIYKLADAELEEYDIVGWEIE